MPLHATCRHENTCQLYRRAPRSEGGGQHPDARRCLDCGALLELPEH